MPGRIYLFQGSALKKACSLSKRSKAPVPLSTSSGVRLRTTNHPWWRFFSLFSAKSMICNIVKKLFCSSTLGTYLVDVLARITLCDDSNCSLAFHVPYRGFVEDGLVGDVVCSTCDTTTFVNDVKSLARNESYMITLCCDAM